MRKLIYLLIVGLSLLIIAPVARAQEENPDEVAKKHGITFPISELGNCGNFSECRNFCDSEANKEACISFAKKKGFHKEEQRPNATMLESARSELGCDSEVTCRSVCENPDNQEKCSSFAQKHNLGGPQGNRGTKVLEKAKELLGCDSESSCRAVCEQEANQEKCSQFASQTGMGGGIKRVGPGGCTSEASCRALCEREPEVCRDFGGGTPPEGADGGRRGPGGCNSEESCRAYCESHPEECGGGRGPGEGRGPEGMDMEKLCRENPERCSGERGRPGERGQSPPELFDRPEERRENGPREGFSFPSGEKFERPTDSIDQNTPSEQTPASEVRGIETVKSALETITSWIARWSN